MQFNNLCDKEELTTRVELNYIIIFVQLLQADNKKIKIILFQYVEVFCEWLTKDVLASLLKNQ